MACIQIGLLSLLLFPCIFAFRYPATREVAFPGKIDWKYVNVGYSSSDHICILSDITHMLGNVEFCHLRVSSGQWNVGVQSAQNSYRCGVTCFPLESRNPPVLWSSSHNNRTSGFQTLQPKSTHICAISRVRSLDSAGVCALDISGGNWVLNYVNNRDSWFGCAANCIRFSSPITLSVTDKRQGSSGNIDLANKENVCWISGVKGIGPSGRYCRVRRHGNGTWYGSANVASGAYCEYSCATHLPITAYSGMVISWEPILQLSGTVTKSLTLGMETGDSRETSVSQGSTFSTSVTAKAQFLGVGVSTTLSSSVRRDVGTTVSRYSSQYRQNAVTHTCTPVAPNGTAYGYVTMFQAVSRGSRPSFPGARQIEDDVRLDEYFCRRAWDSSRTPPACPPGRCGDARIDPNCVDRNRCLAGTWG